MPKNKDSIPTTKPINHPAKKYHIGPITNADFWGNRYDLEGDPIPNHTTINKELKKIQKNNLTLCKILFNPTCLWL